MTAYWSGSVQIPDITYTLWLCVGLYAGLFVAAHMSPLIFVLWCALFLIALGIGFIFRSLRKR